MSREKHGIESDRREGEREGLWWGWEDFKALLLPMVRSSLRRQSHLAASDGCVAMASEIHGVL